MSQPLSGRGEEYRRRSSVATLGDVDKLCRNDGPATGKANDIKVEIQVAGASGLV